MPVLTTDSHSKKSCNTQISTCPHVPVVIWLSLFGLCGNSSFFGWCHQPALSSAKHGCFCWGLKRNHSLQRSNAHLGTVLITEKRYEVRQGFFTHRPVCSTLNRFDEGYIFFGSARNVLHLQWGIFAEWAAFAVEGVKGYALLDTGSIQISLEVT